ncbi:hypothetical protein MTOK_15960 [Mycolicibacterium tokaiense]|nr:hypothetical protein MTOK_15960 [Mycolicibacterium tokaiense]
MRPVDRSKSAVAFIKRRVPEALLPARGDHVTIGSRTDHGPEVGGANYIALDATDAEALTRAAEGTAAIFHTANPGPYPVWEKLWPPMSSALLTATERTGSVYAMAGNLYPLGPVDVPMTENMEDAAVDHKGRLRARIWAAALDAHRAGRIRAFEVRGSDYIGGKSIAGHIGQALPRALKGKPVWMVGRVDTPHTFTDVHDVARLLVAVYDAGHLRPNLARTEQPCEDAKRNDRPASRDGGAAAGAGARLETHSAARVGCLLP